MPEIDKIDRRTDVVFLLFYYAREVEGVTKVQKLLFLIEKETEFFKQYEESIAFNFAPYKMGPFSRNVYTELDFLLSLNAITASEIDNSHYGMEDSRLSEKKFEITTKGEKISKQLSHILEDKYSDELSDLVKKYNSWSRRKLLRYVYDQYPDYAKESEIQSEIQAPGDQ